MSVRIARDTIYVEGFGDVADAEPLLSALLDDRSRTVDLAAATRLHSAIVQLLLALAPRVAGVPEDSFFTNHIIPHLDTGIGVA